MTNILKHLRNRFFASGLTLCFCFTSIYQCKLPTMAANQNSVSEQPADYRSLVLPNSCKKVDKKGRGDMGPILHTWCWTFKEVTNHVSEIAEAGYKSIQIPPVQKDKPGVGRLNCRNDLSNWYLLYQPLNFKIGNCLGTQHEFKKMCDAAHKVGLKVIVDVIANHLAEGGHNGQGYFGGIDPKLLKLGVNNLFHKTGFEYVDFSCGSNRFDITQKSLGGLPGLNTGNKDVQGEIIKFLKELIKCKVDGFRFDEAKNIELPKQYDGDFGSDFWPNVIDAVTKVKPDIYIYGETLPDSCTNFDHYLKYMNITDTDMDKSIINGIRNQDVSNINIHNTPEGWDSGNFVTLVESHDKFANSEVKLSHEDITLGWAMLASRKDSVPLFLSKPTKLEGKIGETSIDTLWKDKNITTINKFREIAADQKEYVVKPNNHLYITFRENIGAVIANVSDFTEHLYFNTENINGNDFSCPSDKDTNIVSIGGNITLNGNILEGNIPGRSVCIIYFKPVKNSFSSVQKQSDIMTYSDFASEQDYRSLVLPNSCKKVVNKKDRGDMGPILHTWCWTFKEVTNHMSEIAKAGYKSIQIPPVQKEKTTGSDIKNHGKDLSSWYLLYQPLNFKIGNCLGTRNEFKEMCDAAHKVGLKVIVDIVANHLAEGWCNGQRYFEGIDSELLKLGVNNLFHRTGFEYADFSYGCNRFDLTQKSLGGLPGLNTGNKEVQGKIIKFLHDLMSCGVDGFRFDEAKNIELPKQYDGDFGSDFWPNVIRSVTKLKPDIYIYGETLPDGCTDFNHYLNFINITDTDMDRSIVNGIRSRDVSDINIHNTPEGWDSGNFVTWVESHDTSVNSKAKLSHEDITLGWAMLASRKGSVPLFLSRPTKLQGRMGETSIDTLWKDKNITAINKFREIAADQKEYVVKPNNHLYITFRENIGAVIANVSDFTEDLYFNTENINGNYFNWPSSEDAGIVSIGGNNITLNEKVLTGNIPGRSVCIIYFKSVPDSYVSDICSAQEQSAKAYSNFASERSMNCRYLCEDKKSDVGPVLHAWNWMFKDVIKNLPEISRAGYRSIQVSPVQKEKPREVNRPGCSKDWSRWYLLYQPLNFKIGNCLGSRDDFIKMCEEAHKLGLRIIVDVVTNHLAEGCFDEIDPELLSLGVDTLFHRSGFDCGYYTDRRMVTQGDLLGLPDINTGNERVQEKIIKFLKDLIDCGADGLRFDAAKHIELPKQYDGDFGSDYWPNVLRAVTEYKPNIYIYAEVLQDGCSNSNGYLNYTNITDTPMGWSIVYGVRNRDANGININNTPEGWGAEKFVTWVESHDTFTEGAGSTSYLSHEDITLGWAMLGGRKDSVPLFLARPTRLWGKMGDTPIDPLWKDEKIAAINKFRKIAANKNECVIKPNRFLHITFRDNVGAIIVNLNDWTENLHFDIGSLSRNNFNWLPYEGASVISNGGNITLNGKTLEGYIPSRSVCIIYFKSA